MSSRPMILILVLTDDPWLNQKAESFSSEWNLPLERKTVSESLFPFEFHLIFASNGVSLKWLSRPQMKALRVDFLEPQQLKRSSEHYLKKDGLYRATGGLPSNTSQTVLDAFLGLGTDAFFLASLGFDVTGIERNPLVHLLVEDGWRRYLEFVRSKMQKKRFLQIRLGDCRQLFSSVNEEGVSSFQGSFDIVYLDPMFPPKKKSAAVGKGMQFLQRLHSIHSEIFVAQSSNTRLSSMNLKIDDPTQELNELIRWARTLAKRRVILKRPKKYDVKLDSVDHSYIGKSLRFDIFFVR